MRNRLLIWGIALVVARFFSGLLSQVDSNIIVFAVVVVGAVLCALITQRKPALLTFPLWYLVYGATRVVDFGEYGGAGYAYGALAYYWASAIIPIIILGIGWVSVLTSK